MLLARSIAFNVAFYTLLVVMMIAGLPALFGPPRGVKAYANLWARASLWLLDRICGVRTEVRGLEHLPDGGVIVAAKHQSFLDIVALLTVTTRFVFVLKRELMWLPIFGIYLRRAGMIPIDRAKGRSVLSVLTGLVGRAVSVGDQLIIFPEGTRRPPGAEPSYKSGVAHLYAGTGASCLPVALNSGLFWPRRSFLRHPGRLVIEVLPPIQPGLDKAAFLRLLQQRIETASDRLLAEAGFVAVAGTRPAGRA